MHGGGEEVRGKRRDRVNWEVGRGGKWIMMDVSGKPCGRVCAASGLLSHVYVFVYICI